MTADPNVIPRAPSCDDEYDPALLPVDVALDRIAGNISPLDDSEQLPLRDCLGRVLAQPLQSPVDVPGHTNSAMDGYALRGADLPGEGVAAFTMKGESFAGRPFNDGIGQGECVRIFTGAVMPAGSDTVVMQEHVQVDGNVVRIPAGQKPGQHVRAAGEDLARGDRAIEAGRRLTPSDLGLAASLGVGELKVIRRPRVVFFSNGDELKSIGQTLAEGDIYDSNRYTLHGMLTRMECDIVDMGLVPDDPAQIREAFVKGAAMGDVLVTSAGASVGDADYIQQTLAEVGEVNFWKLAMKPGRPLAFGRVGDAWFFGLPGNPVSVMVTFYQFVMPALRRLSGESHWHPLRLTATTRNVLRKRPGRMEFQRGVLSNAEDGTLEVSSTGGQGSGILKSMSRANCFIILPVDTDRVQEGETVIVEPFAGLI